MWQPSGRSAATFAAGPWQIEVGSRSPASDSSKRARRQPTNSGNQRRNEWRQRNRRTKEQSQVWRNVQLDVSTFNFSASDRSSDGRPREVSRVFVYLLYLLLHLLYSRSRLSYEALRAVGVRIHSLPRLFLSFSQILNNPFTHRQFCPQLPPTGRAFPVVHISSLFRSCPPRPFDQSAGLDRSPVIHVLCRSGSIAASPFTVPFSRPSSLFTFSPVYSILFVHCRFIPLQRWSTHFASPLSFHFRPLATSRRPTFLFQQQLFLTSQLHRIAINHKNSLSTSL